MFRWTLLLKGGPNKPIDAAVAVDHRVYAFGWQCIYTSDRGGTDVYIFNTLSQHWTKLPPGKRSEDVLPAPRYYHTAVLVADGVYIWGGFPQCAMLHVFNVMNHTWLKPEARGSIPENRYNHSACALGRSMYVYGGETQSTGSTNSIYKLDTATMAWALINAKGTPATASGHHSATMIGKNMFVFGGEDKGTIRVFDTENSCWLQMQNDKGSLTKGSRAHKAFAYNGELYIVGSDTLNNKTIQKFTPRTFSWKAFEPKGKQPVWRNEMCFCMVGHRILTFGGEGHPAEDMHILDFDPSLKTLCKQAVIQYRMEQSGLPHNLRWELANMMTTTVAEITGQQ